MGAGGGAAAGAVAGRLALEGTRRYAANSLIADPYDYGEGDDLQNKIQQTVVPGPLVPRMKQEFTAEADRVHAEHPGAKVHSLADLPAASLARLAGRLAYDPKSTLPGLLSPAVMKDIWHRMTVKPTMDDIKKQWTDPKSIMRAELAARYAGAYDDSKGSTLKTVAPGDRIGWYPGLSEQFNRADYNDRLYTGAQNPQHEISYAPLQAGRGLLWKKRYGTEPDADKDAVPITQENMTKLMAGTKPGETRRFNALGDVESNMPVMVKNTGDGKYALQWADKWDVGLNANEKADTPTNKLRNVLDKYIAGTPPGLVSRRYDITGWNEDGTPVVNTGKGKL